MTFSKNITLVNYAWKSHDHMKAGTLSKCVADAQVDKSVNRAASLQLKITYSMYVEWASSSPGWLTHWGRVTHIYVVNLTIIGSDNGLVPTRRQAIIWTNPGTMLIGQLGTNFSEVLIEIHTFSFNKMHMKISSAKWRPLCLGFNVLNI